MDTYYLSDEQWSKIYNFLKSIDGLYVKDEAETRNFIEAVYSVMRTGCQWRELKEKYGNWNSIFKKYNRWSFKNIWQKMFKYFSQDADKEFVCIDSTVVRAHACSAGYKKNSAEEEALGRSVGGFSTKIHAMVDALGNPLNFILTGGQRHDSIPAPALIKDIKDSQILADKAYDSDPFVEQIKQQNCTEVIPPRENRIHPRYYDEHLYKERHKVECFFGRIKNFRRIFSRFDKTARNFCSFLYFVSSIVWLK